jgi:protein-tyrosine phosphatase
MEIYAKLRQAQYLPAWFPKWDNLESKRRYLEVNYQKLQDLQSYRLNGPDKDEFDSSDAVQPNTTTLNRYRDILPFNHNRVKLGIRNTFINASKMESFHGLKRYIVTQGPLPKTADHFWEMIFQDKVGVIVMLTTETEGGRVKCHRYWPEQGGVSNIEADTPFIVKNVKEETVLGGSTVHRLFELQSGEAVHQVNMIHFLAWPDHQSSDPMVLLKIIDFTNHIYSERALATPIVVHCSAGVGRTGTYCTVDSVLYHMMRKESFPTPETLPRFKQYDWEHLPQDLIVLMINYFRQQRICAVQSQVQFEMCYEAILLRLHEWYSHGQ